MEGDARRGLRRQRTLSFPHPRAVSRAAGPKVPRDGFRTLCYTRTLMARSIATATISFGLVAIPVKLYHAVRRQSVSFNQLDERNMARIRYRKVNGLTGDEVSDEHIVKGYEVDESAIAPDRLRTMDCVDCHNRATHIYGDPEGAVDAALAAGRISTELPYAKKVALGALLGRYGAAKEDGLQLEGSDRALLARVLEGLRRTLIVHADDVIAEHGAYHAACLADLQVEGNHLEFRHEAATAVPAEIAPVGP